MHSTTKQENYLTLMTEVRYSICNLVIAALLKVPAGKHVGEDTSKA